MARSTNAQKRPQDMRHLIRELAPFLRPYRIHLAGAMAFLLLAALATLAFPTALRQLIDGAISAATPGGKGVGAPLVLPGANKLGGAAGGPSAIALQRMGNRDF